MPKSPHLQGDRGVLIDNTQQPWTGGQWERWAVQRKSLSSCDCWVGECTLQLQRSQKRPRFPPSVSLSVFIRGESCEWRWITRSHDGECSSRMCNCCLYEAVFSRASYLRGAQVVHILTAQHIRLSVRPALPPPPAFYFSAPLPWQMIQTAWREHPLLRKHVTLAGYR